MAALRGRLPLSQGQPSLCCAAQQRWQTVQLPSHLHVVATCLLVPRQLHRAFQARVVPQGLPWASCRLHLASALRTQPDAAPALQVTVHSLPCYKLWLCVIDSAFDQLQCHPCGLMLQNDLGHVAACRCYQGPGEARRSGRKQFTGSQLPPPQTCYSQAQAVSPARRTACDTTCSKQEAVPGKVAVRHSTL